MEDIEQSTDVECVSSNIATELIAQALRELERQERIRALTPHTVVLEVLSSQLKCTISRLEHSAPENIDLSDRELQIALLIGKGGSTKTIAHELGIRETTVNSYVRRVFLKLRVSSRAAMVSRVAGIVPTRTSPATASRAGFNQSVATPRGTALSANRVASTKLLAPKQNRRP